MVKFSKGHEESTTHLKWHAPIEQCVCVNFDNYSVLGVN
jgi:hypothetical protein